jgi:exodeoxyribonuclease VII large subunit
MQQHLTGLASSLDALSPLKVLERGYSITERGQTGEVVREASQLKPGEEILTLLNKGRVTSRVESVDPEVSKP